MTVRRKTSFDDHMEIVANGTEKTASVKDKSGNDFLDKIAAELGLNKEAQGITAPAAPAAEGEVSPADSSVAGAAEAGALGYAVDGSPGRLDPDDLGAEVGKHHGAPGAEPHVGQIKNPDIIKYLCHSPCLELVST